MFPRESLTALSGNTITPRKVNQHQVDFSLRGVYRFCHKHNGAVTALGVLLEEDLTLLSSE
jgi:hypothetical protein